MSQWTPNNSELFAYNTSKFILKVVHTIGTEIKKSQILSNSALFGNKTCSKDK